MGLADLFTARIQPAAAAPGVRPRDDELDLFGLTHIGRVRKENQDHFLLATVHPHIVVHGSNLPDATIVDGQGERFATIMLVADGVGSGAGREASSLAVETIAHYVTSSLRCYHLAGSPREHEEEELLAALRGAALEAHEAVRRGAAEREAAGMRLGHGMATTLTLATIVYPWMYVVQVGDSRCYYYWDGKLTQVTHDQTVAQGLVDQGVMPREHMAESPLAHVLSSAIGGPEASPDVTRVDISPRGCVILLCSDGLTKHVADEEIAAELGRMTSAESACRRLLDLALERGGSDNVTIVIGTAPLRRA